MRKVSLCQLEVYFMHRSMKITTFFPPEVWASVLVSFRFLPLFVFVPVFYMKCTDLSLNFHKFMSFWHIYLYD